MVLALDRYAIVKHPRILTRFRPQQMIMFVWSGAAVITSPILYARDLYLQQCKEIWPTDQLRAAYTLSHIAVVYVIPCLTVASCHFSMGHKLCATSHSSLPLSFPLMRQPQHVIIVASVLPDSPSRMISQGRNNDESSFDEENSTDDLKLRIKLQSSSDKLKNARPARKIIKSNRKGKIRKTPLLVKQISRQSLHSRRRLANMLVAMVVVFVLCWTPYVCLKIYLEMGVGAPNTVLPFFLLLGHSHSAINPLVYYLSNRQSLGNILGCSFQWPWEKNKEASSLQHPPPSSTNEAALGVFHPCYTTKRYLPKQGCTNDYL